MINNSSGVYICYSVVNDLRHGNFICKSEVIYLVSMINNSSGVYICNSVVNDLRHGNFICKSEVIYLVSMINCLVLLVRFLTRKWTLFSNDSP